MEIRRLQDKRFMLEITEDEALCFSDPTQIDCQHYRVLSLMIGNFVLGYMMQASNFPNAHLPKIELVM